VRWRWRWSWAVASNARAIENARRASAALSRGRVEREEVELFLRARYAGPGRAAGPVTLDDRSTRAAR
jgi:hypothetical protein